MSEFQEKDFADIKRMLASSDLMDPMMLDGEMTMGGYVLTFGINEVDALASDDEQHPNVLNVYPWNNLHDVDAYEGLETSWALDYEDLADCDSLKSFQTLIFNNALRSVDYPEYLAQGRDHSEDAYIAGNILNFCNTMDPKDPHGDGKEVSEQEAQFIFALRAMLRPVDRRIQQQEGTLTERDYRDVGKAVRFAIDTSILGDCCQDDLVGFVATWDPRLSSENAEAVSNDLVYDAMQQHPSPSVAAYLGIGRKISLGR